jgi:hypothetical protein
MRPRRSIERVTATPAALAFISELRQRTVR